jgi:hypothetical protein
MMMRKFALLGSSFSVIICGELRNGCAGKWMAIGRRRIRTRFPRNPHKFTALLRDWALNAGRCGSKLLIGVFYGEDSGELASWCEIGDDGLPRLTLLGQAEHGKITICGISLLTSTR